MKIRLALADDHEVFRSGLRALLEKEADLEVALEAGSGDALLEQLARREVEVVLLDLSMPGLSGAPLVRALLAGHPRLRVVVLTMHEDPFYLRELLKVGARAFVLKKSSSDEVLRAVRAVVRGAFYVDASLGGHALASVVAPHAAPERRLDLLTPREQEVCRLLALGHTSPETAQRLGISPRTVETHRAAIMSKLELENRAELVRFSLENGLLK